MDPVTIVFTIKDPKRHSVRWDTPKDVKDALTTLYVNKPYFENARALKITIEEVRDTK